MAETASITGLLGRWPCGVQPLLPRVAVDIQDFFDTPSWDRPSATNPTGGQGGGAQAILDDPGFNGAGPGITYSTNAPGFNGNLVYGYTPPATEDPTDGGTIALAPLDVAIVASRIHLYRIEVYDEDGARLASVTEWTNGKLRIALDEANTLSFTIPGTDSAVALMVRPNIIRVRDRWGFLIDSFQIQRTAGRREGDAIYRDIFCQSAIAQLGEEPITVYDGAAQSVEAHVAALLALQLRGTAITLGTIDNAIAAESFAFYQQDTTILRALIALQEALPKDIAGHFWVDAKRRLHWTLSMGTQPTRFLGIGGNLQGVSYETDWSQLANRVYMFGDGQDPSTRLKLTDAGEANEYLEDNDSISTYGLAPAVRIDRRITKPETLLRVANRVLEEFSTPQIVIDVDALDLAKSDEYGGSFDDLSVGAQYRVVDTAQGIDTVVDVVAMEIDMANPLPVRLELTNQARRLSDLFGKLIDSLTQPVNVLGDRYKNMGRNLSDGAEPDSLRDGDTRWNSGSSRGEMYGDNAWNEMGGGWSPIQAADYAELVANYPAASQSIDALAVITGGSEKFGWYEIGDDGGQVWRPRNFWKTS